MIASVHVDLGSPRRLHLAGIGGSGMAPFARLLRAEGHDVSGADGVESPSVRRLVSEGIPVAVGAEANLLPEAVEAVVHSAAVPVDAPLLVAARNAGLPVVKYASAVGSFAASKSTIAVAGTHGKTTTTALSTYVLRCAGRDPSFLVGGCAPQLGGGSGRGASDLFVVEACEYDRSFLHLEPEIAVVTNVEADHLDYYRDLVEIVGAFQCFCARVRRLLIVHESLKEALGRAGGVRAAVRTFGTSTEADVRVVPGARTGGLTSFTCAGRGYRLRLPGHHNLLNAAAVLCLARELALDPLAVEAALVSFAGVGRRLQVVGRWRGVPVVDDYAHHPTEICAGLAALRDEFAPRRLWCVFQPHQYSRTRRLLADLAEALAGADRVVIPEIFAARDRAEDRGAVRANDLVAAVRARGGDAVFIPDFSAIVDFVRAQAKAGDVVVTMGAGDVGDVAGRLAAAI